MVTVMLCHASDTTLPLFDTLITVTNMNNINPNTVKMDMLIMSQLNVQNQKTCSSSTGLLLACYTLNSHPHSD